MKATLELIELSLKIVALAGGVAYFAFKMTNGFYIFNLSVDLKAERQSAAEGDDYLTIVVSLKKGDVSTLVLHDIQARLWPDSEDPATSRTLPFLGLRRPDYVRHGTIAFDLSWKGQGMLRLRPSEGTQFSVSTRVPRDKVCFAEVAVIGRRAFVGVMPGLWKATMHILPR